MKEVISVRGLNKSLLRRARTEATHHGKSLGDWINDAIQEKLFKDYTSVDLTGTARPTEIEGVSEVPLGTVETGVDYTLNGYFINAAGRKGEREVVTYRSPSLLHDNGYEIFWIR